MARSKSSGSDDDTEAQQAQSEQAQSEQAQENIDDQPEPATDESPRARRDTLDLAATRYASEPYPTQESEFVPQDVRDHPYIFTTWETIDEGHPMAENISARWGGTQETNDMRTAAGQPDQIRSQA